jgi:hypothetical protein
MTFLEKFRMYFPELSEAPDDRVVFFSDIAKNSISAKYWGNLYDEGLLNLTAHLLTSRFGKNGNGDPVTNAPQGATSKTVGKLSKGLESRNSGIYANAGDYALTVYGRRYWELLQLIKPTVLVISGGSGCAGTFSR